MTLKPKRVLNPNILPSSCWEKHTEYFKAANSDIFHTSLITKKSIGIQFFQNCVFWTKVIGSTLPDKDILIGFDILYQMSKLQIMATGIRFKHMILPYTDTLQLYSLSDTQPPYQTFQEKFMPSCAKNHSQFTHPFPQ